MVELVLMAFIRIARWALTRKEFVNFTMNDIMSSWEACMVSRSNARRRIVSWSPPSLGVLKFNIDGAKWGKLGPAGIGEVI